MTARFPGLRRAVLRGVLAVVVLLVVGGLIRSWLFRRNEERFGMKPDGGVRSLTPEHPVGPGGTASR